MLIFFHYWKVNKHFYLRDFPCDSFTVHRDHSSSRFLKQLFPKEKCLTLVLREELVARGLGSGLSVLRPWSLRKWGTLRTRERVRVQTLLHTTAGWVLNASPVPLFFPVLQGSGIFLVCFPHPERSRHSHCCLVLQKDFVPV